MRPFDLHSGSLANMNGTQSLAARDRILVIVGMGVVIAYLAYALLVPLETVGRHLLPLGLLRLGLLGILVAFARTMTARSSKLGRVGLWVAGSGAILCLVGGIGSVVMDGWTFDPFSDEGNAMSNGELWYAFVIGFGVFLFLLGPILTGIAGRAGGWLAAAAILGGALYLAVPALEAQGYFVGHAVWLAAWLGLGVGLLRSPTRISDAPTLDR